MHISEERSEVCPSARFMCGTNVRIQIKIWYFRLTSKALTGTTVTVDYFKAYV